MLFRILNQIALNILNNAVLKRRFNSDVYNLTIRNAVYMQCARFYQFKIKVVKRKVWSEKEIFMNEK